MGKKFGALLRLIDVVLILFFGFITIADLTPHKRIDLRRSSKEAKEVPKDQYNYIYRIHVRPDGTFLLNTKIIKNRTILAEEDNQIQNIAGIESFLQQRVVDNPRAVVKIDPADETKVQQTVDLLDLCEKHRIEKATLEVH